MTKTCLDVLKQLGNAFSSAIEAGGKMATQKLAPYVLKNETGLPMTLNLELSHFKVEIVYHKLQRLYSYIIQQFI